MKLKLFSSLFFMCLLGSCGGSSSDGVPTPTPIPTPVNGGLDLRVSNSSCIAPDLNTSSASGIALELVFDSLPGFLQPLGMMQTPGDSSRWFVMEKGGRIRSFNNVANVGAFDADFIDLSTATGINLDTDSEGGLLGMAFHPDYENNGEVFLSWTETASPMVSTIARFTSNDGGISLDPATRENIITVDQAFENHNGGSIGFGLDNNLYIGFGDGGSSGDPDSRAQDTTNLLGTLLRIDVDGASPYEIPTSNPFAGNPVCPANYSSVQSCPEIFAWGLRNPWRWSVDTATGDIWVGDVGQGAREEINIVQLNGNYGWDCREGSISFANSAPSCSAAMGLIEPVFDYSRTQGFSVTGGYVYRGSELTDFIGDYFFADYGSGRIWRLTDDGAGGWIEEELLDTSLSISSFAQDNDGELYVIDIAGGGLYKIVAETGASIPSLPVSSLLSGTGCVLAQNPVEAAVGLLPYETAASFWSDGAVKERWFAIPDGSVITRTAEGDFSFPIGSVLMKHFRLNGRLIETRLFMHHPDGNGAGNGVGSWAGYSYEWNDQQTDASLLSGSKVEIIAGQDWLFPSGNDCLTCHTVAAGYSLGLEDAQLNHDFTYALTGRTANQLLSLDEIVFFNLPLGDPQLLAALLDPNDVNNTLDDRARAYLHTNCAQCHRPNGPTPSSMDLRFSTALATTGICDAVPQSGDLGIGNSARLLAPGDPGSSVLLARMNIRDVNAMPPLGSTLIDTSGVSLLSDWIASVSACN